MFVSATPIKDAPYDFFCPHCQAVLFRLWQDRKIEYFNSSWAIGSFALTQVEDFLKVSQNLKDNFSLILRIGKQPCCYRAFYYLEALITDFEFQSESDKEFLFNKLVSNINETNYIVEGQPDRSLALSSISRRWQMSVMNTSYGRVCRHRFGLFVYDETDGKSLYECLYRAQSNFVFWCAELQKLASGESLPIGSSVQIFDLNEILEIREAIG